MNHLRGWKLATVRGVPIYLHISLIFLLFYVVLIASAQFPIVARESGVDLVSVMGNPFIWGLVFAVALLVSILLHEIGHVWVAQVLGGRVQSITLLMLGGISQMERFPEQKYAEFKISVVGPLVSFAIAAGLYFLERSSTNSNVVLFSYWLARVNLVLGIFNLLPAFPTDGGRVLRSILAARMGKLRGTRIAVQVSRAFAWIFGIFGLLQFNLLLVVIAFFIYAGATAELNSLVGRSLLRGIKAGQLGRRMIPISEDTTLDQVAVRMVGSGTSVLPVRTDTGGLAVISTSLMRRFPKARWPSITARDAMLSVSEGVEVDSPLESVFDQGMLSAVGGVPLLEHGQIVGVICSTDIAQFIELRSLAAEQDSEQQAA